MADILNEAADFQGKQLTEKLMNYIMNYYIRGQTGKTIIDCHEEFEQAQNEW